MTSQRPPSPSLPSAEPQGMSPGQKRSQKKTEKKTNSNQSKSHCSHTACQQQTHRWTWPCNISIQAQAVHTHTHICKKKNKDLLYGVTGLSILQPWPRVKRRGPGPLGASEGPAACCGASLGCFSSCCCCCWCWWRLCGCWLG